MHPRAGLVAMATVTGLLAVPTSATAVTETCQGRPATIVAGPDDGEVKGTEGDDVIVGHSASIFALGGNDLICLDSGEVFAGDGNDSVLATGTAKQAVYANLGEGDDRYVGGPGQDSVDYDYYSPGSDNISTGAGRDGVSSRGPDEPNHDVIDLGPGEDSLSLELPAGSSAHVRGGAGRDGMDLAGAGADYVIDLGAGLVTRAGVETASLSGFEGDYRFWVLRPGALRVVGTSRRDVMVLEAEKLDLQLGDGPDIARLLPISGVPRVPKSGVLDLGSGKDLLQTQATRRLVADLPRGRLMLKSSSHDKGRLGLVGVERLNGGAQRVVMRGGRGSQGLSGFGCHVLLSGGPGSDKLLTDSPTGARGCGSLLTGGPGEDLMFGGRSDDQLLGGPGRDVAHGARGTDTCKAEREFSCER